jgi:hypothetical protein
MGLTGRPRVSPGRPLEPGLPDLELDPGLPERELELGLPERELEPGLPDLELEPELGLPDLELEPGLPDWLGPPRRVSSRRGGREDEPEDMGRHATGHRHQRCSIGAENAKNALPANPVSAFLDRNPATSYSPRGSLPKYHRR